jgi:hypothetical protein
MNRSLILLALGSTLLLPRAAAAMPGGINGYSGLTPDKTCAVCHPGGNPPIASLTGPTTLAPGATGVYTFTLETDRTFGGLDVAVDDPAAKLEPMSPMTQLLATEITHTQPLPVVSGKIVVQLELTAPPSPGIVKLHADGQADKMPQIADSSAAAVELVVTVAGSGGGSAPGSGGNGATTGGGAGEGTSPMATPMRGCAFAGSALPLVASGAPLWLVLLGGLALVLRRRRP